MQKFQELYIEFLDQSNIMELFSKVKSTKELEAIVYEKLNGYFDNKNALNNNLLTCLLSESIGLEYLDKVEGKREFFEQLLLLYKKSKLSNNNKCMEIMVYWNYYGERANSDVWNVFNIFKSIDKSMELNELVYAYFNIIGVIVEGVIKYYLMILYCQLQNISGKLVDYQSVKMTELGRLLSLSNKILKTF
ncbi:MULTISPECIES: hypothetical protein [Brevibacillus]